MTMASLPLIVLWLPLRDKSLYPGQIYDMHSSKFRTITRLTLDDRQIQWN